MYMSRATSNGYQQNRLNITSNINKDKYNNTIITRYDKQRQNLYYNNTL